ncbi:MAG: BON domain-containing protein [Pseudomonadota bacterium]
MKIQTKAIVFGIATAFGTAAMAEDKAWEGQTKDAWIDGKLEASYLLNSELSAAKIGTHVENGNVVLTGSVPTDAHKELAKQIAENLNGVADVDNQLTVSEKVASYDANDKDFSSSFYDMTTTMSLKSKYAVNDDLEAHEIDIDTKDGVVTLQGEVATQAEKMLAEEIAKSNDHVGKVNNQLKIVAAR